MFTSAINLSENDEFSTLEILKVGQFSSPSHGNFSITKEMLRDSKKNFDNNIHRLTDQDQKPMIPLNFAHDKGREAAGWIKELELNDEETVLVAKLMLTPIGREKVTNKEFAFASAEFSFKLWDPELKQEFKNVLTGAALTNIPFMKGLKSIELTENETIMEQILKLLNDLTDEEKVILLEKIKGMIKETQPEGEPEVDAAKDEPEKEKEFSELESKFSEKESEVSELKKELEFSELLFDGKVVPAQKEAFLKGDMKGFVENSSKELNFDQESSSKIPEEEKKEEEKIESVEEAEVKVAELAEAMCKEDNSLDFAEASKKVLSEREDLSNLIYKD